MRQEQARKKQLAQREAREKETEAKRQGRKDPPWLQKHLVVKVFSCFYLHWNTLEVVSLHFAMPAAVDRGMNYR